MLDIDGAIAFDGECFFGCSRGVEPITEAHISADLLLGNCQSEF